MRIEARGFIVLDFASKSPEAIDVSKKALSEGKLKMDGGEHIVKGSCEDVPNTWLQLFSGNNTGKLMNGAAVSADLRTRMQVSDSSRPALTPRL